MPSKSGVRVVFLRAKRKTGTDRYFRAPLLRLDFLFALFARVGVRPKSALSSFFARSSTLRCEADRPLPPRLRWKVSIDIAERNGALLRRLLRSAERLSDAAMARGLRWVKTPCSRSSALLVRMTRADQRLWVRAMPQS